MNKIVTAAVLGLGLVMGLGTAAPAQAYSTRPVTFDPAADLARTTGSAQYPGSAGSHVREARVGETGSQAMPQPTSGLAHAGIDMLVGGSSRYPVLTPDVLSHPPTALDQDHALTHEFDGEAQPAPGLARSFIGSTTGGAHGGVGDGLAGQVGG